MVYDIVDIFMHLTLKEKEAVLKELQAIYDASVSTDAYKTPLEEAWEIVESNIYSLSREPYIDDQFEIEEIWQICEDLIRNEDLSAETWARRKRVLSDMIENGMYDYYGVWDPMNDLLKALCFTDEEWLWCADEMSNGYMKEEGAAIYREHGRPEKYYGHGQKQHPAPARRHRKLGSRLEGRRKALCLSAAQLSDDPVGQ